MTATFSLLAQSDSVGVFTYINPIKLSAVLVLFVLWAWCVQWVDRDAERVKTSREWWNILVLIAGLSGAVLLFVIPWRGAAYFLGLAFWLVPAFGGLIAYVVHRNGRVRPENRVMTPTHFKRVLSGSKDQKKQREDKGIRVKLQTEDKESIDRPEEPEQIAEFDACQDFLFDILWKRAAVVDVLVTPENTRVVYKIDGVATEQSEVLPAGDAERIITFLKRVTGMNPEERRRPQTGRLRIGLLASESKPDTAEVVTSGSTTGERLRLKIQQSSGLLRAEELGFSADTLAKFNEILHKDDGVVLVAGPKEAGVTTTMYAALRSHDAYLQNVYSLERQPEQKLDNITQQVYDQNKAEATYGRTLQTVLRREPDVVLVSECADRETAQIIAKAGVDKKIYAAVEAANSFDGLARYAALVEDPKLCAESLAAVVGVRLLRKLCPACREAYRPDEQLLRKANLPIDKIENFYRPPSQPIVDKKGREIICQTCQNSRYVGRTGVFELLVVSDAVRKLLEQGASIKLIKDQARKERMLYLQEQGLRKVMEGETSMAEVMRALQQGK